MGDTTLRQVVLDCLREQAEQVREVSQLAKFSHGLLVPVSKFLPSVPILALSSF